MNSPLSSYFSQINDAKVVSFDIFDTLIGRTVASPSDVFKLVSPRLAELIGFSISEFPVLRSRCEKRVKEQAFNQCGIDDVSIYEIYEEIFKTLGVVADVKRACSIEMECEQQVLISRELGKTLFNYARSENKDIILISDMYLPKDFISNVLNALGFDGWIKFYLSVDHGKSKSSGALFDVVLSDLKIEPEMMIHIGDNPHGDIAVPRSLGIRTLHTPRTVQQLHDRFSFGKKVHEVLVRSDRSISSSVTAQLVSDKIFAEPLAKGSGALNCDPFMFGYCSLGPLFSGFSAWLNELVACRGVDKLLFLSRDGQIAQRVFTKMIRASGVSSDYCYASRRISRICSIKNRWDIVGY